MFMNEDFTTMNKYNSSSKKCKRCNKPIPSSDIICQDCKSELLTSYEASSDWQTAFEIEKAAQSAMRYQMDEIGDDDYFELNDQFV
jgi:hypothetical protein